MKLALSLVLLVFSLGAFAAEQETKHSGLDLIKLACKDPGAVHNQIPPSDIKITCRTDMCEWVPGPGTFGELPNWRKVCGSLMTNKPGIKVPKWCWPQAGGTTQYSCPTVMEECSNTELVYNVTCDEVMAMNSLETFCAAKLTLEIEANESILTVTRTGKTMGFCNGSGTVQQK